MSKWRPLIAVCLGTFMLLLDVTIVVVAMPEIADGLDASLSDLQWVIDVYALTLAALLLGSGVAADIVGRRRFYAVGTTFFALASVACGLAQNSAMLVAFRGIQGAGAAAMFATTLSLLSAEYEGRDRSVALGVWGAVSGAAAACGPILGGMITESVGWRWIFFVNLPVSAVAIALTVRTVRESKSPRGQRIDWAGTVAFAVFAGATVFGVVRAEAEGWGSAQPTAAFTVAALSLVAFVLIERRTAHPLLALELFRRPAFVGVMIAALALNGVAFGVLAYTQIWLQTLLDMSPVRAGLVMLPLALSAFFTAAVGGRLLHGVSARLTIGGGLLLIGGGTLGQAVLDEGSSWSALVAGLIVSGVGVGLVNPSVAGAALAALPAEKAGMAGGAVNTFRQLGYAFGVALFGTITAAGMEDSLQGTADPHGTAHTLVSGGGDELSGVIADGRLHSAFADGLNGANLVAGGVAIFAAVAVLVLVRPARAVPEEGQQPRESAVSATR